jgi:hypothetical protein
MRYSKLKCNVKTSGDRETEVEKGRKRRKDKGREDRSKRGGK